MRRRRTQPTSATQLDDGRANLAAGTTWLWVSAKMPGAVDVLFVDEAGQISLANVVAIARRDREPRPARGPAAARPADAGHPSARRRPLGARPRPRRPRDDATGPRPVPRDAPGGCTRTSAPFTSEVFYDDRLETEPHLVGQRLGTDALRSTASGRGSSRSPRRRRQRVARRGRRGRRDGPRVVEGRRDVDRRDGRQAPARLGATSSSSRRTTPRSARSRGSAARRRPASARSTSSRARRRRSASTR